MRVGVISDNHGRVDPALLAILGDVEEIWHAGDLVTPEILGAMRAIAPLRVVRGNNDASPSVADLPDEDVFVREGLRILIRHIVGSPASVNQAARESIKRHRPDIVVMGHSHRPMAEQSDGVLFLNPGSCGPRRFSLPRTASVLEFSATQARFQVMDLDQKSRLLDRTFVLGLRR